MKVSLSACQVTSTNGAACQVTSTNGADVVDGGDVT